MLRFTKIVCDSHIDYGLPQSIQDCSTSSGNKNADWLEIRYKFASICSKINQRRVSSAEIGAGTAASNKCKADEIVQELDAWYEAIPEGLQVAQHVMQVNLDPADKRVALGMFYRYHEALLLYCGKQCINPADGRDNSIAREMRARCMSSIRSIYTVGIHVGNDDYAKDL
ncbi:hypothetical protein MPH_02175 [Macrophomina phaseolina MS6]|uniref:Uncharacterized protein n=1 Tax=Macrophomina phaseolina (strain MS6) TaxID=1126212 RepID=K2S622_MACPH|nr:hypothetical protein MPH_02175 [Macrophomina phaseolina MS6]